MSKNNVNMKSLPADKTHRIGYLYDENATGVYCGYPYKGIVIAIMGDDGEHWDDCVFDAVDEMVDREMGVIDGPHSHINHGMFGETQYYMKPTYKGIAYCAEDDKFNLKEGMRIARNKMLNKYYKDKLRIARIRVKEVSKMYNQARNYLADINKKLETHK